MIFIVGIKSQQLFDETLSERVHSHACDLVLAQREQHLHFAWKLRLREQRSEGRGVDRVTQLSNENRVQATEVGLLRKQLIDCCKQQLSQLMDGFVVGRLLQQRDAFGMLRHQKRAKLLDRQLELALLPWMIGVHQVVLEDLCRIPNLVGECLDVA